MRAFTRYASGEFLKVFLITVTGMTMFMFAVVGIREAIRHGLGPGPFLKVMPYVLPESMRFSVPAASLLAACTVFGRMSADNEVVAVKSLGISPLALMTPALVTAFFVSLAAVWVNDVSRSWGLPGRERAIVESIEQIVYGMLNAQRSYKDDQFSLAVKRVEGRILILPTVTVFSEDGHVRLVLTAKEAELRRNPDNNSLSIFLTDWNFEGGEFDGASSDTFERIIPLSTGKKHKGQRSPSDYALRGLNEAATAQRQRIAGMEQTLAAQAAYQMLTGDVAGLMDQQWRKRNNELRNGAYRLNRIRIEPWRRWANGFSSFFFVLVGVPLSIRRRNSDFMTNFFFCFLPILVLYYPLMMYGVDRAKEGALPFQAVWLGNLVMAAWGLFLMRKVIRH